MEKYNDKTTALAPIELTPIETSRQFFMVILFHHSTSKSFSLAMNLASKAPHFKTGKFDGKDCYLAGFNSDKASMFLAQAILEYIYSWKGSRVFVGGDLLMSIYRVRMVLACLTKALQCDDSRAHCNIIDYHQLIGHLMSKVLIQPPEEGECIFGVKYDIEKGLDPRFMALRKTPKILHPCRFIYPYIDNLQWGHPSSVPDQLQAAAVRLGCHWCPLFDPTKLKVIGQLPKQP